VIEEIEGNLILLTANGAQTRMSMVTMWKMPGMQMDYYRTIKNWIRKDAIRMEALAIASELELPGWCLAAGFVRNLVWDQLHEFDRPTDLNDIDLIYFDPGNASESKDRALEERLGSVSDLPWSVKNQARMHQRNEDEPYLSTADAMSYWVELETAVGASLDQGGSIKIVAPFGVEALFQSTITVNSKRPKPKQFEDRIKQKRWLEIWPNLVERSGSGHF